MVTGHGGLDVVVFEQSPHGQNFRRILKLTHKVILWSKLTTIAFHSTSGFVDEEHTLAKTLKRRCALPWFLLVISSSCSRVSIVWVMVYLAEGAAKLEGT